MATLDQQFPLSSLKLRWMISALCGSLFLGAGFIALASTWQIGYAVRWLLQAGMVMVYGLFVLKRSLPYNVRTGESKLLSDFGVGNIATLVRGGLIAGLAGFLLLPWPPGWLAWAPGILFTAAVLADFVDGYLARVKDHVTRMGEMLDMSFDGLGVFVAALLAVQYGKLPIWYLAVALARYLFLAGIWLRRRRRLPVYDLPPSIRRRAFAGVQMGFLFFVLWPVFSPQFTHMAAFVIAAPFLTGFLLDWLITIGCWKGHVSLQYLSENNLIKTALNWLPAGLRSIAAILIFGQAANWYRDSWTGMDESTAIAGFLIPGLIQILLIVFLLLGASGRLTAIVGLFLISLQPMSSSLTSLQIALIVLFTAILYLGTGPLSLWKPEDRWIYQRAGERTR